MSFSSSSSRLRRRPVSLIKRRSAIFKKARLINTANGKGKRGDSEKNAGTKLYHPRKFGSLLATMLGGPTDEATGSSGKGDS